MFKVGDKVRYKDTQDNRLYARSRRFTCIPGEIYVIEQLNAHGDCCFFGADKSSNYSLNRFEALDKESTPQELADEWRKAVTKQRELRRKLLAMGYRLEHRGQPVGFSNSIEDYKFTKTVTTTETL